MNPKELEISYQNKKDIFHKYIDNIKRKSKWDIFNIINPTLIKNPYASEFPKRFFSEDKRSSNKNLVFIKVMIKYYIKNIYLFISYFIAFLLLKLYFKKQVKNDTKVIIDIFGLVDNINKSGKFDENYLKGVYEVFEKCDSKYTILLRPYGINKNPFKLKQFFKIIKDDKRDFIFEYELLGFKDFMELFTLVIKYPFKTLRLMQNEDKEIDKVFNNSLIEDIRYFSFNSLSRYILGKKLAQIKNIRKIYSWSEFQVIERSFNYGIRSSKNDIELISLQFYLNYETYFNSYIDDLDYEMLSSPHKVLVNGKYYIKERKKLKYEVGVSPRYKEIFNFQGVQEEKNILILGSYIESDTQYMLDSVSGFENVIFKNHPAVDILKFGKLDKNITVSNENIYKLFETTKLVIGTASGTSVEAVSCGISVIIIASQNNLTANPLVSYGKGKIWDVAFSKDDVKILYNKLINNNDNKEILEISNWYKTNFFVEPSEKNIVNVFELKKGRNCI